MGEADGPRGRRIHIEGAGPEWSSKGPPRPSLPPAAAGGAPPGDAASRSSGAVDPQVVTQVNLTEQRLADQVAQLTVRLDALAGTWPRLREAALELGEREAVLAARRDQAARDLAHAHRLSVATELQRRRAELGAELARTAELLAPGPAGRPWSDAAAPSPTPAPAAYCRFGELAGLGAPALAPLIGAGGWFVVGSQERRDALVLDVVSRLVEQTPIRQLSLQVFDPRVRGVLGSLAPLRNVSADSFPPPSADARAFAARLENVLAQAGRNAELTTAGGARSLLDLWTDEPARQGIVQVVVVLDHPFAIDDELGATLLRLAAAGPAAGTCLVVAADPAQVEASGGVADLTRLLVSVVETESGWTSPALPAGVVAAFDPSPAPHVPGVVARARSAAEDVEGPTVLLSDLVEEDVAHPWRHSAMTELVAPIGRQGERLFELALRTANPPLPNMLVGGAIGQGKSNLLMAIIYSLACRYSPEELELQLLDFKQGLEFACFDSDETGENWLPHVSVLSLESNQAFGLAVLRHLNEQMAVRAAEFKSVGASSLDRYRELSGRPMPRILLIVDEFHALAQGDERYVDESVALLERLARQGRAFGVHLLLSSQTVSGIEGLALKGDSIFAQFPLRMSLRNTAQESQSILGPGNTAAASLAYRGEVVLNRSFGNDPEQNNERALAALVEPAFGAELQRMLWRRGHGSRPASFVGSSFAEWRPEQLDEHKRASVAGRLQLWLGRPIEITDEPCAVTLDEDTDQAVAIVGQASETVWAVLGSALVTAAHGLAAARGQVVVLDGTGSARTELAAGLAYAEALGLSVQHVERTEAAAYLRSELTARLDGSGPPLLVLGLSLQQLRGMDDEDPSDQDLSGFVEPTTARTVMKRLATSGALDGVHLVGWWGSVRACEEDLGPFRTGVGTWVAVGVRRDDLQTLAGAVTPPVDGSPRAGVIRPHDADGLLTVVPFSRELPESGRG